MDPYSVIAAALGVKGRENQGTSPFVLISEIEKGLPVGALDRLSAELAPGRTDFKYRIVPRATYMRRNRSGHLSSRESAQLARLARIWEFAKLVWGSPEEARAFMFRTHPMLEDRPPVDVVVQSEIGSRLVEDVLGRLAYGSAA